MSTNLDLLKKKFSFYGYIKIKDFFPKKFISYIIKDINNSKNTIKYFDTNNNLRRIERLYDKGKNLNVLNIKIMDLLKKIFNKDFLIFKDKYNAKPPGGDGFFAHYDGIFNFIDTNNIKKKGWYEYGDYFINVLIALDECNKDNGSIEIAKYHSGNFEKLLKNTKKNGTPAIKKEIEKSISFNLINLNIGDLVIFSNKCPHRSKKNNSDESRRVLYYTYSLKKYGSKYKQYFSDKVTSKNPSKALEDKL
jgi:ectoine hydroxylase-related dioxygenase (phytanoyl-CoA dioxygenase family)